RKGVLVFDAGVADLLLEGSDRLEAMILDLEQGGTGMHDIAGLMQKISGYDPVVVCTACSPTLPARAEPSPPAIMDDKQGTRQRQAESRQTVRVKTEILDHLINTTGELITN